MKNENSVVAAGDGALQVFAGFQCRRRGLVDSDVMRRFYDSLEEPLAAALGAPVRVHVADEPLAPGNWGEICREIERSAICLFEISDNDPNTALMIGAALAFGKRCFLLMKINARRRMMTDIGNFQVHVYEDLADPDLSRQVIDFLAADADLNCRKLSRPASGSRAKLKSRLEEKRRLLMRQVLGEDEIHAMHRSLSINIDANFRSRGLYYSRARIAAQLRLEKDTARRLSKNKCLFGDQISNIDKAIRDITAGGLAVTDGKNTYIVIHGAKLKVANDGGIGEPGPARVLRIAGDLLDLIQTGEPIRAPGTTATAAFAPSIYVISR